MELTQISLQRIIIELIEDEDWGEPNNYDITITKKGEGRTQTSYSLTPKESELSSEIKNTYKKANIDLELLFESKDPFNPDGDDEEENPFDEE